MLKRVRQLFSRRSRTLANPSEKGKEAFLVRPTTSGVHVTEETALRSSAVFAAVRVLSESVASLPLIVYRRLERGKERATDHPLYEILHDRANEEMSAFTFREVMMRSLLLWGNAYAEIVWGNDGYVKELWPLLPNKMTIMRNPANPNRLVYLYETPDGEQVRLEPERVLHIVAFSGDGLVGRSPIAMAREAIGLSLAAEEFGARFFGQGATLGGVLEHPGNLSEEAMKRLRESFENMHMGLTRAHRIAILEEGMSFKQIGIPPEDAQFLETRKFQVNEIARIFRVPPHMIGDLERATFSNIEHQSIEFVVHSLRPWLVRWEQAINWKLFTPSERKQYFAEFLVDGLLRGDIRSRYEAYAIGRQWGWLSANDVRELENLNPVAGGDVYLSPMNMIPATSLVQESTNEEGEEQEEDGEPPTESRAAEEYRARQVATSRLNIAKAHRRMLAEAARRILEREAAAVRKAARKVFAQRDASLAAFEAWLSEYYHGGELRQIIEDVFFPALLAYAEVVQRDAAQEVGAPEGLTPEMVDFLRGYLELFVMRYVGSSTGQLREVAREAIEKGEDPVAAIEERLAEWQEKRPDKVAHRESNQAANAVAVATYLSAGVLFKRWVAVGDTCPYCRQLDGRVLAIAKMFLEEGEEYQPEGADTPLVPRSNIGHPPLHQGCDCMVVAAFI